MLYRLQDRQASREIEIPEVDRAVDGLRMSGRSTGPVGFLVNVYPHVSHSFIRREIQALEGMGMAVVRFSIRAAREPLPDVDDQAEQARTIVLLDAGYAEIASAAVLALVAHPGRFLKALRTTIDMGRASAGGGWRHVAYLLEACFLERTARQRGIRHIHAHFGTNSAAVARLAAVIGDITFSMTVHGPEEFDAPVALSLPDKIHDAAFVVAISRYGGAQLMRWSAFADWTKIRVVRCGLDRAFLDRDATVREPREGSRVLLCIARLEAQKGLSLLIEAAARIAAREDFTLRIVGDGSMRAALAKRILELGLGGRIVLLGWQSAAVIRQEIEAARILVLSSFAEGLPVVLMEAMALECPVIATAIAGIPELVGPDCGWIVPAGSVEAMADAMLQALQCDDGTLRAKGAAGRRRVLDQHDASRNAAELAKGLAAHA